MAYYEQQEVITNDLRGHPKVVKFLLMPNNVCVIRKRTNQNEVEIHKLINEKLRHCRLIIKLVDENGDNFETMYCEEDSIQKQLDRIDNAHQDILFEEEMQDPLNFLQKLREILQAYYYIHDIGAIVHNSINLDHVFLNRSFKIRFGGFGYAVARETKENITTEEFISDLCSIGHVLNILLQRFHPPNAHYMTEEAYTRVNNLIQTLLNINEPNANNQVLHERFQGILNESVLLISDVENELKAPIDLVYGP